MSAINLSEGNVPDAAASIGELVRISGPVKSNGGSQAAEMLGYLSGITYLDHSIIVYMEGNSNQTTTFLRTNEPVTLEQIIA